MPGHALYIKALHGGKTKNDRIDAHKIAVLLRGGMLPQAYGYPKAMRGTRDLLRRRNHLMRKRADLLAHIQNTASQCNLPPLGTRVDRKDERAMIPAHFPDPVVRRSVELDPSPHRSLRRAARQARAEARAHGQKRTTRSLATCYARSPTSDGS